MRFMVEYKDYKTKEESWGFRQKMCNEEMFRYATKPPRWIQSPNWPIVNGNIHIVEQKIHFG